MTLFNPLNIPTAWEQYYTKYPEGYTILEALLNWVQQVNDMVVNQNDLNTTWETFQTTTNNEINTFETTTNTTINDFLNTFDTHLQDKVEAVLGDWQTSGFLNMVINTALQTQTDSIQVQVNTNTSQIAQNASRITALATLTAGSTSGDAELIDGRTGANGVTYSNIGNAIRTQITQSQEKTSYKKNILPISYTSGGYWNKDANNNLNLVANTSYNCVNNITLTAGKTYTTGIVMGYYSWIKKTSDGTVTRLDNTAGTQESTYTFTPTYDCTLWLSVSNGKLPYVMVIENATSLPTTYKAPNVIFDIYVKDRLIDNIDKIAAIAEVVGGSVSSNIQNATMTSGYYWNFVSPNMTKVTYANYNTLEPIELKAGVPYTIGKVYGVWSWVYDKVTKTATKLDTQDRYLTYTVTPTNDSQLYLTCNSNVPQVIKNAYELPPETIDVGKTIETQITGLNKKFMVGPGLQYTSLTAAIADAVKYPHSIVEVKGGTYDLYQEQGGASYFDTFTYSDASPTFCGIVLKNDVKVIFSSDAKVTFNYPGTNAAVMQYYSPFNAAAGIGGFTLENLNLAASKCRYAIHDERGYTLGRYKNSYKNCKVSLDNSQNTAWNNYQCIGGGLGVSGYIEIDGCQFTSVISSRTNIVSYHNNGDSANPSKSNVFIKNSWFCDNGYARIGYYGPSTELSEMVVTGCSYNQEPTMGQEGTATVVNVKLTKYANELRA